MVGQRHHAGRDAGRVEHQESGAVDARLYGYAEVAILAGGAKGLTIAGWAEWPGYFATPARLGATIFLGGFVMFSFWKRKTDRFTDKKRSTFIEAISSMLATQLVAVGNRGIEDPEGNINPKAIGYIYGFIDAALQTIGQDMSDTAVGVPITVHILKRLFPGQEERYALYLVENIGKNEIVMLGAMSGGQQYIDFNNNKLSAPMGLARAILDGSEEKGAAPEPADRHAALSNCDLIKTRDAIADMHRLANEEAEAQGGTYYWSPEYVAAWTSFRDKPTIANAEALLRVAPALLRFFEMHDPNTDPIFRLMKESGLD